MRIIPVLDLMEGEVVRGVAGRREEYRAVQSCLVDSAEPRRVAHALREALGLVEFYVADLDAIAGAEPDLALYGELVRDGFRLLVDAGVRDSVRAMQVAVSGVEGVVVGLETLPRPEVLADVLSELGSRRVVFSLDLRDGQPLGDLSAWRAAEPVDLAREAIGLGVRRLIVLDLARVGVGQGLATEAICRDLRDRDAELEVITGGGVRGGEDLMLLAGAGVDGVLVASALHDGRIGRAEVDRWRTASSS